MIDWDKQLRRSQLIANRKIHEERFKQMNVDGIHEGPVSNIYISLYKEFDSE